MGLAWESRRRRPEAWEGPRRASFRAKPTPTKISKPIGRSLSPRLPCGPACHPEEPWGSCSPSLILFTYNMSLSISPLSRLAMSGEQRSLYHCLLLYGCPHARRLSLHSRYSVSHQALYPRHWAATHTQMKGKMETPV